MARAFPTGEDHHPYDNRTLYGAAKLFDEGLLRAFHDMHGLDYVALRYFNVYGPRMDMHGRYTEVLIRWMERIEAGLPPIIFGDGSQTMDFVHVHDVARANVLRAAQVEASDVVLNVGTATETSLRRLAELLAEAMGRPDLVPEHAAERAVNPVPRRLADTEAARRLLGFEAAIPLEQGLLELVAWWRANRDAAAPERGGMIPIARPSLGDRGGAAAAAVRRSGWLTQGAEVAAFEAEFAASVGAPHACAVSNCTTALHLALLAAGVGPGDEVVTVSHSFIATANVIRQCGAVPVFVDIDPVTFNLDPPASPRPSRRAARRSCASTRSACPATSPGSCRWHTRRASQ